jgi:hypothetical protein
MFWDSNSLTSPTSGLPLILCTDSGIRHSVSADLDIIHLQMILTTEPGFGPSARALGDLKRKIITI